MRRRHRIVAAVVVSAVAGALAVLVPSPAAAAYRVTPVNSRRIIGYSVQHRPIVAYRLGDPQARITAVLLGEMHGDEHAGVRVARSIIHGRRSVEGIDLWVIPTMNPDGDAAHTRQNARHVDLNRNWPDHWTALSGETYSGPWPLSEPETRAMRRFLLDVRPRFLVALHQPLYGVDTTDGGALDHAFRDRLADNLGLPLKAFRCWGFCHGSMTGWYTTHRYGIAETVEFGAGPPADYLTGRARIGIVAALGGHFGRLAGHNPRSALRVRLTADGRVRVAGWAYDIDALDRHVRYTAHRDGVAIRTARAAAPSPLLDAARGITGEHAYSFGAAVRPGPHTFCLTFTNIGAGTGDPRRCVGITVPTPTSSPPAPTSSPAPSPTSSSSPTSSAPA